MSDASKEPVHGRIGETPTPIPRHADMGDETLNRMADELDDILNETTADSFDEDKLNTLLAAFSDELPLPDAGAVDADAALERFYARKAANDANKETTSAARRFNSSHLHRSKRGILKTVLIAAALMALIFLTSVQAFGFDFFGLIARWSSEVFGFQSKPTAVATITRNPLAPNEERSYDSVQAMLDDFGITAPLFPTWVPERFGFPTVYARNVEYGVRLYAEYESGNNTLLIVASELDRGDMRTTEVDANANPYWVNDAVFYFMSDTASEKATWYNSDFECQIYGTVSRDELKQIVSSIYEG